MTDPEKPRTQGTERDSSQPIQWQSNQSCKSGEQEPRDGSRDVETDAERLEDSA